MVETAEKKFASDMAPEVRSKEIGGSEAGIIMGFSKWASSMDLWMQKKGLVEPVAQTIPMTVGKVMEPLVANLYEEQIGDIKLSEPDKYTHLDYDWMVGHIDRLAEPDRGKGPRFGVGPKYGLECKTANPFNVHDWGEPGTDEVPKTYFIQVMHYMAVTGLPYFDIAVLIGNNDFRVYRVHSNSGIITAIIEKEAEFMDWLKNDIRPPIDASESSRKYLLDKYPKHGETEIMVVEADEVMEHLQVLKDSQAQMKKLKEVESFAKNKIMEKMGDAPRLVCPLGSISFKTNKDSKKISWEGICSEFDVSDNIMKKYTTVKPGSRVFRPNLK